MDSSEVFSAARSACVRAEVLDRQIAALEEQISQAPSPGAGRGRGPKGQTSDPTYAAALSHGSMRRRIEWLRMERRACDDAMDECRVVLDGMRQALGDEFADVMGAYYLSADATWETVADGLHVTVRTVLRRRSVALDWVDDVGVQAAKMGYFDSNDKEDRLHEADVTRRHGFEVIGVGGA